ncbi:hypothetical protein [Duganella sp. BJB1802]|uniref:hypothetical protein n=1 Tax=Duganella sp. BJB1802 TaxID=2744575 RepID=UPI001C3CBBF7|nr:hypothetical protein [Duganella sp. BJB1802]
MAAAAVTAAVVRGVVIGVSGGRVRPRRLPQQRRREGGAQQRRGGGCRKLAADAAGAGPALTAGASALVLLGLRAEAALLAMA